MNKIVSSFLILCFLFLMTGCSKNKENVIENSPQLSTSKPQTQENFSEKLSTSKYEGVDIDLSALSDTMVYAQLYSILSNPDDYEGKVIRMKGDFDSQKDEKTGEDIFGVVVSDATACCILGLQFDLIGDYSYPDDFPKIGSEMTVTGTFETYTIDEQLYAKLNNSKLK